MMERYLSWRLKAIKARFPEMKRSQIIEKYLAIYIYRKRVCKIITSSLVVVAILCGLVVGIPTEISPNQVYAQDSKIVNLDVNLSNLVNASISSNDVLLEREEEPVSVLSVENITEETEEKTGLPFTETCIRLNNEIYDITSSVVNLTHINTCFAGSSTVLGESYKNQVEPLMFIALTNCETGMWKDTRYTWSSAVYSGVLADNGVNLDMLHVSNINMDTFCEAGLYRYLDENGTNDSDSLGPLQIRRGHFSKDKCITYSCGEASYDLMCWKDNLEYTFHSVSERFVDPGNWASTYAVNNKYELMALIGVMHNTGTAYLTTDSANGSAGSLWKDAESVYSYCEALSNDNSIAILSKYIDDWYNNEVVPKVTAGEEFVSPSQYYTDFNSILSELGVNRKDYASSYSHKQDYPLRAILEYMGLLRLYDQI